MTDTVRCWLVDRTYDDKGLIRLTYAPVDGRGQYVIERAAARGGDASAAVEIEESKLESISEDRHERYVNEADRMAQRHDPDETI